MVANDLSDETYDIDVSVLYKSSFQMLECIRNTWRVYYSADQGSPAPRICDSIRLRCEPRTCILIDSGMTLMQLFQGTTLREPSLYRITLLCAYFENLSKSIHLLILLLILYMFTEEKAALYHDHIRPLWLAVSGLYTISYY